MDFEDFCESYKPKPENKQKNDVNANSKSDSKTNSYSAKQEDWQEKIEKYKSYSNEQLLSELLKEVNIQKRSGNLTDEKLKEIVGSLSPFLDEKQKEKLNEIVKMLR